MPRFITGIREIFGCAGAANGTSPACHLLAPWPSRSLFPSVPKAPALRPVQTNVQRTEMNPGAPLLLIDVDGVISLFGFSQTGPPPGRFTVVDGIPHYISARAGERLARL